MPSVGDCGRRSFNVGLRYCGLPDIAPELKTSDDLVRIAREYGLDVYDCGKAYTAVSEPVLVIYRDGKVSTDCEYHAVFASDIAPWRSAYIIIAGWDALRARAKEVKVSAIGVDARPRGHFLSIEKERELRGNPPPMVIDDIDERDIPRKLDPRPTSEIISTLVREVAADLYGLAGYARNMHLRAARQWEHVADIQQRRVSCECFNPVQTAQAATGRANEATKAAPPNVAAFTACIAALTACALGDAQAAAEAHRRAAAAYSASGDDYDRLKPDTQRRIDAGLLKLFDWEEV